MAEGVIHLFESVHIQIQQGYHLPTAQRAGNRLLQQMMELHPVRDLGERVVTGQVANAALGTLTIGDVAGDEDVALELRVVALDMRSGERDRYGLSGTCPDYSLASLLRRLREIEVFTLTLIEHGHDAAAKDFFLAEAQQLACRGIGELYHTVGRGHEHRVRHAVQDAVQVALVNSVLAQTRAHALERLLQITQHITSPHFERAGVVALPDAVGALDEGIDRPLDPVRGPPRDGGSHETN